MNICEYGCGKEAVFQIGLSKKWCCSERYYDCTGRRKKLSDGRKGKWDGENNPSKNSMMIEKRKKTLLEHYGVEHPMMSEIIRNKVKNTFMEKYGVEYVFQNKGVMEKVRNTQIERYGGWYTKTLEYRVKSEKTCLEKYGVDSQNKSVDVKEKKRLSNQENWGVDNVFQNKEIKELSKQTMLNKYGCEYNLQRFDIKNGYKWKEYIFPSGKKVSVQGYENKALDKLLKIYNENDIIVDDVEMSNKIGQIYYILSDVKHRYFPDIYIKSENKIVEVKSEYTLNADFDKNMEKRKACLERGYNFVFMVL